MARIPACSVPICPAARRTRPSFLGSAALGVRREPLGSRAPGSLGPLEIGPWRFWGFPVSPAEGRVGLFLRKLTEVSRKPAEVLLPELPQLPQTEAKTRFFTSASSAISAKTSAVLPITEFNSESTSASFRKKRAGDSCKHGVTPKK